MHLAVPLERQIQVRMIDASSETLVDDGTQVFGDSENSHAVVNAIVLQHENGAVQVVVQAHHDGIVRLKQLHLDHVCVS